MIDVMSSFVVKTIIPINFWGLDISITNSSLFMIIVVAILAALFFFGTSNKENSNGSVVPSKFQMAIEETFYIVGNIVKTNAPQKSVELFPYIIALFLFILFGNVLGLFPFAFSFTSQIAITFAMATAVFVASIIVGLKCQGLHYFRHFCPEGIPSYLVPFFIVIELMSFLFRPVSLGIRLFANMVSGHIMIEVIASFAASLFGFFAISAIFPVVVDILLNMFKLIVCGLQAYVFVVLSCIYLSESIGEKEKSIDKAS